MHREIVQSKRLDEKYFCVKHPSGLTILMYPMQGYSSAYALFATNYGSENTCFKTDKDDDFVTVPEGIAHYLEHKLFESEEGDAFARYAKTGASANAYTSFEKTAYLFSCADNFKESLEILLDFVTDPYFTEETVRKEQGIIGQEITMYDDNPDWRVYFNLLRALYQKHPVRIDIAGTIESIAQINADLLYRCYHTFYNLHNMVLAVAGNFDPQQVIDCADRILKPAEPITIETKMPQEPVEVCESRVEINLPVSLPMFQIGFKEKPEEKKNFFKANVLSEILLEIIAGEASPLYRRLYDKGLINAAFDTDVMNGNGYFAHIFAGESRDPDEVQREILKEIHRLKREGISKKSFESCKKKIYGRYVRIFNNVESVASLLINTYFMEENPYRIVDIAAEITLEEIQQRLQECFDERYQAISIVKPVEQ